MPQEKNQNIEQKMIEIASLIEQGNENKVVVENVNYYQFFQFNITQAEKINGFTENNVFVAEIVNNSEGTVTYELYSANTNELIGTVNEQGKVHFMPEYLETIKEKYGKYFDGIELDNINFELPKELGKDDRVLTKNEREYLVSKQKLEKNANEKSKEEKISEKDKLEEERSKNELQEEAKRKKIAQKEKVPEANILMVRENSNLYKDHPEIEPNLYFCRGTDGSIKAKYIDENDNVQSSKYFEASTTMKQEVVSLGNDGNQITREVPYQVMKTKGLNHIDKDIRDIRMVFNIDAYGYLEVQEARQGTNGQWVSHDVEVKGRSYNSQQVNESTSIRTRRANPDEQTEAFEKVENTVLAEDGIQYDELYLMEHAEEIINSLEKQGYEKEQAVEIFNLIIGEEKLTIGEAKERVEKESEISKETQEISEPEIEEEERTQGGEALERLWNRRKTLKNVHSIN